MSNKHLLITTYMNEICSLPPTNVSVPQVTWFTKYSPVPLGHLETPLSSYSQTFSLNTQVMWINVWKGLFSASGLGCTLGLGQVLWRTQLCESHSSKCLKASVNPLLLPRPKIIHSRYTEVVSVNVQWKSGSCTKEWRVVCKYIYLTFIYLLDVIYFKLTWLIRYLLRP